ncbi:MAG TPA: hypothetical protein VFO78_07860 [Candidatus Limnocylindrales bacterium]|nr:hypothetical protein [Candidatus Limnocylindrales bacterium]
MADNFVAAGVRGADEVDWRSMDPRDRQPPFASGVDCAVCGRSVPADGIRILARRDDLTFVELACLGCRSETLGIIVAGHAEASDGSIASSSGPSYGEFVPADDARFHAARPIDADDVVTVRELLAKRGLEGLVGPDERTDGSAT